MYNRITYQQREVDITSPSNGLIYCSIKRELGRNASTISRGVCFYQSSTEQYSAQVAHEDEIYFRSRHRRGSEIDTSLKLRKFILIRFATSVLMSRSAMI